MILPSPIRNVYVLKRPNRRLRMGAVSYRHLILVLTSPSNLTGLSGMLHNLFAVANA